HIEFRTGLHRVCHAHAHKPEVAQDDESRNQADPLLRMRTSFQIGFDERWPCKLFYTAYPCGPPERSEVDRPPASPAAVEVEQCERALVSPHVSEMQIPVTESPGWPLLSEVR